MNVTIPPEFEELARERVADGAIGSVEEAAALVLRDHVRRRDEMRALIDEGLASGPGEIFDRETFMEEFRERLGQPALT